MVIPYQTANLISANNLKYSFKGYRYFGPKYQINLIPTNISLSYMHGSYGSKGGWICCT